jgi:hypothetical protein
MRRITEGPSVAAKSLYRLPLGGSVEAPLLVRPIHDLLLHHALLPVRRGACDAKIVAATLVSDLIQSVCPPAAGEHGRHQSEAEKQEYSLGTGKVIHVASISLSLRGKRVRQLMQRLLLSGA